MRTVRDRPEVDRRLLILECEVPRVVHRRQVHALAVHQHRHRLRSRRRECERATHGDTRLKNASERAERCAEAGAFNARDREGSLLLGEQALVDGARERERREARGFFGALAHEDLINARRAGEIARAHEASEFAFVRKAGAARRSMMLESPHVARAGAQCIGDGHDVLAVALRIVECGHDREAGDERDLGRDLSVQRSRMVRQVPVQ